MYIAPAILQIINPCQFGAIPKSSTAHALISMIHNWTQATDATGAAVRVVLFDYKKAFDLIDHQILIHKILTSAFPAASHAGYVISERIECNVLKFHTVASPNGARYPQEFHMGLNWVLGYFC